MKRQFLHLLFAAGLALSLNLRDALADTQASSLAPLVEKTSPAVVNIYAQKLLKSRSAARLLDGSGFWRLFKTHCYLAMAKTGLRIRWVQAL